MEKFTIILVLLCSNLITTEVAIVMATSSGPITQQPTNIPQVPQEVTDVPEHEHQPEDNNA